MMSSVGGIGQGYVTIQLSDGTIFTGMLRSLELEQEVGEVFGDLGNSYISETTVGVARLENIVMQLGEEFVTNTRVERAAPEWKCFYCEAINKMSRVTCAGCQAPRPFVLDI